MFKYQFVVVISCLVGLAELKNVIELTPGSFDALVKNSRQVWVVEFYSPSCPYCQDFAPEYEAAAKGLGQSNIKVGRIDATQYGDFSKKFNISGFPTVKMFHPDNEEPADYHGPRTAESLMDIARSYAHDKKIRRIAFSDEMEPQCKVQEKSLANV